MTYQEQLIEYCKEIARIMKSETGLPIWLKYNLDDEYVLRKLTDEKAEAVIVDIRNGLNKKNPFFVWPFCSIAHNICHNCEYAKNHHGTCGYETSDARTILQYCTAARKDVVAAQVKNIERLKAIVGLNFDMRYNKALCDLMEAKKERLALVVPHEAENYFNKNDKAAIMSWKPELAKKIFERIKRYMLYKDEKYFTGFGSDTCPFCIKIEVETCRQPAEEADCTTCEYAQEHVSCLSLKKNRYSIINDKLERLMISPNSLLNFDWYLKTLEEIKQKHNID